MKTTIFLYLIIFVLKCAIGASFEPIKSKTVTDIGMKYPINSNTHIMTYVYIKLNISTLSSLDRDSV